MQKESGNRQGYNFAITSGLWYDTDMPREHATLPLVNRAWCVSELETSIIAKRNQSLVEGGDRNVPLPTHTQSKNGRSPLSATHRTIHRLSSSEFKSANRLQKCPRIIKSLSHQTQRNHMLAQEGRGAPDLECGASKSRSVSQHCLHCSDVRSEKRMGLTCICYCEQEEHTVAPFANDDEDSRDIVGSCSLQ